MRWGKNGIFNGNYEGAEHCNEQSYVCLYITLSTYRLRVAQPFLSTKPPNFSPNVLCVLPMAVAWSSSDGIAIGYVLPVLWMTTCCYGPIETERRHDVTATASCTAQGHDLTPLMRDIGCVLS